MLKSEVGSCGVNRERRFLLTLNQLVMIMLFGVVPFVAQIQEQSTRERKLITRVEPQYPDTLKRLYIGGVCEWKLRLNPTGL